MPYRYASPRTVVLVLGSSPVVQKLLDPDPRPPFPPTAIFQRSVHHKTSSLPPSPSLPLTPTRSQSDLPLQPPPPPPSPPFRSDQQHGLVREEGRRPAGSLCRQDVRATMARTPRIQARDRYHRHCYHWFPPLRVSRLRTRLKEGGGASAREGCHLSSNAPPLGAPTVLLTLLHPTYAL